MLRVVLYQFILPQITINLKLVLIFIKKVYLYPLFKYQYREFILSLFKL